MIEKLKDTLATAETTANDMQIDQIAWMIGNFPTNTAFKTQIDWAAYPRIAALLPEMQPYPNETHALMVVADYMNREDSVGQVAERIRKVVRG